MSRVIYTLANTSSRDIGTVLKVSAVRSFNDITIISLLTQGDLSYEKLLTYISHRSNSLFVDTEKKQQLGAGPSRDYAGNLYKRIFEINSERAASFGVKIYPIKMNDLTVSAVLRCIYQKYPDLSGLTASLVGVGNIGFKLALALTESGCHVKCYNRTTEKAFLCSKAVTYFKPQYTIASPEVCVSPLHAFVKSDFSILSCSALDFDLLKVINLVKPDHRIYVLGHSLFPALSLRSLKNAGLHVLRVDVGQSLISYVVGTLESESYQAYGRRTYRGVDICSGGFIGNKGDVIVDDVNNPRYLLGVCDGFAGISSDFDDVPPVLRNSLCSYESLLMDSPGSFSAPLDL